MWWSFDARDSVLRGTLQDLTVRLAVSEADCRWRPAEAAAAVARVTGFPLHGPIEEPVCPSPDGTAEPGPRSTSWKLSNLSALVTHLARVGMSSFAMSVPRCCTPLLAFLVSTSAKTAR